MTHAGRPVDDLDMEIIDAYIEHLRRAGRSLDTMKGRRGILHHLNRDLPFGIGVVLPEDLADWLYRDDWSQNTKATYYRALKSFYGWASDPADRWINRNPMDGLERVHTAKGVARPCTDEQLRAILARAAEPFRLWALIAAYQGLRCVEIAGLDREHVTESQLFVVRGKGGQPRVHDTDPGVWQAVRDLPPGPVARRPDTGERASAHYISIHSRAHFHRKLKIETSMHCLRHWLGVNAQARYRDIRVTQELLGHASLTSTQIYTRATAEQQRAARATLPRFAG